jgi:hypothetical protein
LPTTWSIDTGPEGARVGRIVAVVTKDEDRPFGNHDIARVTAAARGPIFDVRLVELDPVDEDRAALERDLLAGKPDDPLDVGLVGVRRGIEHDDIPALRRVERVEPVVGFFVSSPSLAGCRRSPKGRTSGRRCG